MSGLWSGRIGLLEQGDSAALVAQASGELIRDFRTSYQLDGGHRAS
jgi:hypothetical protein